ncbi:MAG: riboflavin synthase [Planctomycetales bacterium]|nr:riboflavin synthase [Planctomycetales bacterium]
MFTGLVEGIGVVRELIEEDAGLRIEIKTPREMADGCRIGDSVALNGCCLTVIACRRRRWSFEAGPETLTKTNLKKFEVGTPVNLERALLPTQRLGGHIVQGHVDGVGRVAKIDTEGDWTRMWFRVPKPLAMQMVSKGSVAVDGVSLTVVDVSRDQFSVALIPHTLTHTTLGSRSLNDAVNIETDILAKYVQKLSVASTKRAK